MDQQLLTRKELYDLVWSTPLTTLAKKYGLSDNGLRKICNKLNIPLPKSGYWMKLQFNKKVEIIALPLSEQETTVTFSLKEMEKVDAKKALVKEIKEKVCLAAVPQRLSNPDPLIVQAKQRLLERDSHRPLGHNDMVRCFRDGLDIMVTVKNVNRALCFMDALIKGLYKRGHEIIFKNGFTYVHVIKQEFRIVFREKTKRVVIPGKSWNSSEFHPTGILYFKYDRWGSREWKDGGNGRMGKGLWKNIFPIL
jgi:hypothetical protein